MSKITHPYYPLDAQITNYAENEWGVFSLLGAFFGACTALFSVTCFFAKRIQPGLTSKELLTIMWFVLSGTIHIFFEGYYVTNYATLGAKQTLIGQMWKEYSFSDSRYLTNNSFVLCMETITVFFWGPGCLLVAALIVLRHPLRYPLQCLVSFGHIYGDVLYYATASFEHYSSGISYCRPEAFYFWFYFIFMNSFWIFIPACKFILRRS